MTAPATTLAPPYEMHPAGFVLPRWRSPEMYDTTRGPDVTEFTDRHMRVLKGPLVGRPMTQHQWQRWLIDGLLEVNPATGRLRHRRGLVGVARQNGKGTGLGTPLAIEHIFDGPPGSEAYAVAGDRQQARIIFDQARKQVLNDPELSKAAAVYRDAIEVHDTGSIFRTLSSDGALAQGLSPSLVVFDEVHVQRDDELWDAMTLGTGARLEPLVLGITTAGTDPDSLAGRLFDYGKRVAVGEIDDPSFFFAWYEAEEGCNIHDPEQWIAANPSLIEGTMSYEDLEVAARQQSPGAFRRYRLNQWIDHAGSQWIDPLLLDEAENPGYTPTPGDRIAVTFDGSVSEDSTAIMIASLDDETPTAYLWGIWEADPSDDTWRVPRNEVHAAVHELFAEFEVALMIADPAWWRSEIQEWQDAYGEAVLEWPVTNARMGPAVAETYKRISERTLLWDGNPITRRHISNAVVKQLPSGYETIRKDKRDSPRKIDAAVTMVMLSDALERINADVAAAAPGKLYTF